MERLERLEYCGSVVVVPGLYIKAKSQNMNPVKRLTKYRTSLTR